MVYEKRKSLQYYTSMKGIHSKYEPIISDKTIFLTQRNKLYYLKYWFLYYENIMFHPSVM